jgi:outer membrane protein TolC
MRAYYEWLAAGEILRIQKELLSLAEERQVGLVTRAEHGDVAAITATENNQNIYRRQGLLNDGKRLFANASANLALYFRDKDANMITPDPSLLSRMPKPKNISHPVAAEEAPEAYQNRPEFSIVEAEIEKQRNELTAGENRLLPRADLSVKTARDTGNGSLTRMDTENVIGINISIPLENNTAEGRITRAKTTIKALEYERQMLRNKIAQQLQFIENDIGAASRFIDISRNEVIVAEKMQASEQKIFNNGGSDFFLLNMREEQLANAKIKNVSAQLDYYRVLANYYAASVKLEKLYIK